MNYYDASVVFYKLCIKSLEKNKKGNKKGFGIVKNTHLSSITSQNAKIFLDRAIRVHDYALKEHGEMGRVHRCRSQPFDRKNGTLSNRVSEPIDSASTFTDHTLWFFNNSLPLTEKPFFGVPAAKMADQLCRGEKPKVTK